MTTNPKSLNRNDRVQDKYGTWHVFEFALGNMLYVDDGYVHANNVIKVERAKVGAAELPTLGEITARRKEIVRQLKRGVPNRLHRAAIRIELANLIVAEKRVAALTGSSKPKHITQAAADKIILASRYADRVEDSERTDDGFVYTLENGKWVKVLNDGTIKAQR